MNRSSTWSCCIFLLSVITVALCQKCSLLSDCYECANEGCGWCANSQICLSLTDTVNCGNSSCLVTLSSKCPIRGCASHTSCFDCVVGECGWCAYTQKCMPNNSCTAPCANPSKCYKTLINQQSMCSTYSCNSYNTCSSCMNQYSCTWCLSSNSCVERGYDSEPCSNCDYSTLSINQCPDCNGFGCKLDGEIIQTDSSASHSEIAASIAVTVLILVCACCCICGCCYCLCCADDSDSYYSRFKRSSSSTTTKKSYGTSTSSSSTSAPYVTKLSEYSSEYSRIQQLFINTWTKGNPGYIKCVYAINNTSVNSRYRKYQGSLDSLNTQEVFHGTNMSDYCRLESNDSLCNQADCAICNISKIGFKLSKSGTNISFARFGRGIYFALNSSKANDYNTGDTRAILLCNVAAGKEYHSQQDMTALTAPPFGYHSVRGTVGLVLNYPELVVYNEDAITVTHIIVYSNEYLPVTLDDSGFLIN